MTDLIILKHLSDYPLSRPQDIVKLLFQRYFGPGHMVTDEIKVRVRIEAEMMDASEDTAPVVYEPIGNGFFRFHLKGLNDAYGPYRLSRDFIRSASFVPDSEACTVALTDELKALSDCEEFFEAASFTREEYNEFTDEYIKAGCPLISHSDVYKKAYKPAYRVVRKD